MKIGILSCFVFLTLLACNSSSTAPTKSAEMGLGPEAQQTDTIGLEVFWKESVQPILDGDLDQLGAIIHFPIEGSWGSDMGYDKPESEISKAEFFAGYSLLFDDTCVKNLKELSYTDTDTYIGEGFTQLRVSNGWEVYREGRSTHLEGGIVLSFRKYDTVWKLFRIESMR